MEADGPRLDGAQHSPCHVTLRGKVHRPSAAPSPGTAASASERRVLAQISQNEQSLGGGDLRSSRVSELRPPIIIQLN